MSGDKTYDVHALFWFPAQDPLVAEYLRTVALDEFRVDGHVKLVPSPVRKGIVGTVSVQFTLVEKTNADRAICILLLDYLETCVFSGDIALPKWFELLKRAQEPDWIKATALGNLERVRLGFVDRSVDPPFQVRRIGDPKTAADPNLVPFQVVRHPNRAWLPSLVTQYTLDQSKGSKVLGALVVSVAKLNFQLVA